MALNIDEIRRDVDRKYVGMAPNTTSVKPVHIANGLFRASINCVYNTSDLNRFVFWQKKKGGEPVGHDLDTVYSFLQDNGKLDSSIQKDEIAEFRLLAKEVLSADAGVYVGSMASYSAGACQFVAKDRIGQEGGELVAQWLQEVDSSLDDLLKQALKDETDPISMLFKPLVPPLDQEYSVFEPEYSLSEVEFLSKWDLVPKGCQELWHGMRLASNRLYSNLKRHPNKLFQLRMIVLFACFTIARHMACLESYYYFDIETTRDVEGRRAHHIIPFLLDFSASSASPIRAASCTSYLRIRQSIARFYSWAFAQRLADEHYLDQLASERLERDGRKPVKTDAEQAWMYVSASEANPKYEKYGETLFDILASESASPVAYFRQLGVRSGLLWPPTNFQMLKRFAVHQDMLEMLILGAAEAGREYSLPELQDELWRCYGVVIGGRPEDMSILVATGIYQADQDELLGNRRGFAERLSNLDYGRILADGVFEVQVG